MFQINNDQVWFLIFFFKEPLVSIIWKNLDKGFHERISDFINNYFL
jgi:hypothetical protein